MDMNEQAKKQASLMLKLLIQAESDIQNNRTQPQEKVFSELRESLESRAKQKMSSRIKRFKGQVNLNIDISALRDRGT